MGKRYDDKLHIDMPFSELVERYAGTKASEMYENIDKAKKAKPPRGKPKRKPPGGKAQSENVLSFRKGKTKLRNKGRG